MLMKDFWKRETWEHKPNFEGTGTERKNWGTGNIRKHLFLFGEQGLGNKSIYFRGIRKQVSPFKASLYIGNASLSNNKS